MCFGGGSSAPVQSVQQSPVRSLASTSARSASAAATAARGVRDTIATTALGDTGFGSGVRRPTFLGQTGGAYA